MPFRTLFRCLIVTALTALSSCATDGQQHRGPYVGAEGGVTH